jgi:hypothetical protein
MDILDATRRYEGWLQSKTALYPPDLELKHRKMAEQPSTFLRGSFYRWAQLWPEVCPECASAPPVLAIADLHVENFGTWRDSEGRLVWGVNDFDEAYPLAYTADLVRLAASVLLAIAAKDLSVDGKDASRALLQGYQEGLASAGQPLILAEENEKLRDLAYGELRDPERFWKKIDALPEAKPPVPVGALRAMEALLPDPPPEYRVVRRTAGIGSLGRQRYVAVARWNGGKIAREAKALVPSACVWAYPESSAPRIRYRQILSHAIRCLDPGVRPFGRWIVRRLSPDCAKIELASLSKERDELRLLQTMGRETANVHLGSRSAVPEVLVDLRRRSPGWLCSAAEAMVDATLGDWKEFREAHTTHH